MNILFVSHEKQANGSTNSLINLIEGLRKNKEYNCMVIIPGSGMAKKNFDKRGIKYCIIKSFSNCRFTGKRKIFEEFIKKIFNWLAYFRLCFLVNKQKIDIIHSNSSTIDIGAMVAKKKKIPHIYHIREFLKEDFGLEYINENRTKKLIEESNWVIFISEAVRTIRMKEYSLQNYSVLYNGFNCMNYFNERNDLFSSDKIKLIMCGTLYEKKGTMQAVKVVDILKNREGKDVELVLAGNGSPDYIQCIKEYINEKNLSDNIQFAGYKEDLSMERANADINLTCSKNEAFGRCTVEGMLAGLLVIGTNTGGTVEIIENEVTGLTYELDSTEELVDKIIEVYQKPHIYRNIAKNGQKMALSNFDYCEYANEVSDIYKKVCKISREQCNDY